MNDDTALLNLTADIALAAVEELAALTARMTALAAEADAGGDHATGARIRAALWGDDDTDDDGEGSE